MFHQSRLRHSSDCLKCTACTRPGGTVCLRVSSSPCAMRTPSEEIPRRKFTPRLSDARTTDTIRMVSVVLASLNRGVNFRLGISSDGVRIAHGLLETRKQTVPPGRVQAVHFKQSLLWRKRDWWNIVVNVAGYQDNQQAVSTLLPVGTREDALAALWSVLPDLGDPDPEGTVSRALSGSGADGGFVTAPVSAKWVDPFQRRFRGVLATETALFIRRGWLVRELIVVPHERTQSLALTQGPIQRALGLANVAVHSTKGVVNPVAQHL